MKYIFLAILAGIIASPASATECYTQTWSNASSTTCDDGTQIDTHGDTVEVTRPDASSSTLERYGDQTYSTDDQGNEVICTTVGSITTCR